MKAIGGVEGIVLRTGLARVQRVIGLVLTGLVEEGCIRSSIAAWKEDRAQSLEVLHTLHAWLPLHKAEMLFSSTASVDNSVDERLVV